jgi:type IV pilus biogenesis protein CpaD/CtpE
MAEQARRFADARPNNGSSFTVRAGTNAADVIARAIASTGVAPADIRILSSAETVVERIDRVVSPEGCEGAPETAFRPGLVDDGYSHDNANGALFGCAVRRNIAAMVDDPRTLVASNRFSGRDGTRSADIYSKWTKGQRTETESAASAMKTSDLPGGDSKK